MKAVSASFIKQVLTGFLVAAALVVLSCGTEATAITGAATLAPGAAAVPAPRVTEVTLRVGLPFLSSPPDPVRGGHQALQLGLSETLFKLNSKDLRPEPWLATAARQVNEKTWEITLRPGVKFHDGAPMDAAAVKASLERAVAKSPRAKATLDIARIEVGDPSTLTIVTNGPSPILQSSLTEPTSAIANAGAAETMGDAFTEKAVLTGPFKVERFQQDNELVAVRHTDYWGGPPLVDRVISRYIPDANSRLLALQSGDIDIAVDIAPEGVVTVQNDPKLVVRTAKTTDLIFIFLNHRREPAKDAQVRKAIDLAVNREALVRAVMQGQATAAAGLLPPTVLGCDQLRAQSFDPDRAKQVLSQAGYQDKNGDGYVEMEGQPLNMTLLTYKQRPALPPIAEAIQASLKIIGIKVSVRLVENPISAIQQGDWDGAMWFGGAVYNGEPHPFIFQLFATGGDANRGAFSDPQVDELTRQLGQATDRKTLEHLFCAASQAIIDKVAIVPLLFPGYRYGVSRRVVGFDELHPYFSYFIDSQIGKQ